jgi:hypothetical protein
MTMQPTRVAQLRSLRSETLQLRAENVQLVMQPLCNRAA